MPCPLLLEAFVGVLRAEIENPSQQWSYRSSDGEVDQLPLMAHKLDKVDIIKLKVSLDTSLCPP